MTSSVSENYQGQDENEESKTSPTYNSFNGDTVIYKYNSDDDLGRLMNFAEQLKEKCEYFITKIEEKKVIKEDILFKNILLSLMPLLLVFFLRFENILIFLAVYIMFFFFVLIRTRSIVLQLNQQIQKLTRKLRSEEVALEKIVDLLRDFGRIIAEKQGWDELRKIELKLRLSRFEIGRYEISKK